MVSLFLFSQRGATRSTACSWHLPLGGWHSTWGFGDQLGAQYELGKDAGLPHGCVLHSALTGRSLEVMIGFLQFDFINLHKSP